MYLTARNANRPSDDPIFALNREATQRRAAGERVINATVGALLEDDGALAVLPSVLAALREVPAGRQAGYAPIAGAPDFLDAVVQDLLGGTPLAAQAVACATPGGSGALRHAVTAFLEHGQALVTPSFYWGPYATICDENERALRTFPMFGADGLIDAAGFEAVLDQTAAAQGRLLIFLNDPCNNPTGYSMNDAEWTRVTSVISRLAARVPVTLLLDVAYLAYGRDQTSFLRHVAPLTERALVLFAWSASKSFAQYGLRVGALVACTADAEQRQAINRAMSFASRGTWSNCNAGGQAAIARCITDATLRARVEAERARLRALLDARVTAFNAAAAGTGLAYPRYDGGFFVTVFTDDADGAALRMKADGVFVVPIEGALRLGLCSTAKADVVRLVESTARAVRA
jgi:aromatic-amino-acid transaminase